MKKRAKDIRRGDRIRHMDGTVSTVQSVNKEPNGMLTLSTTSHKVLVPAHSKVEVVR